MTDTKWLDCAKWLNDCGVLNEELSNHLHSNTLTISDFAFGLRDGIILCNLINKIVPDAINPKDIVKTLQPGKVCINNINLFLEACSNKLGIPHECIFQPLMLYDKGIELVINTLSKISATVATGVLHDRKSVQTSNQAATNATPEEKTNGFQMLSDPDLNELQQASYYINCDRSMAQEILSRIQNPADVTLFLLRPSQNGDFAISLKYDSSITHIRLHILRFLTPEGIETRFCLVQQKQFNSIGELIVYYMTTSLEGSFNTIKTTIGIPYRDALPNPICEVIAVDNFHGVNKDNRDMIELKKYHKYYLIKKNPLGWWTIIDNSKSIIGFAPGNFMREIISEAFLNKNKHPNNQLLNIKRVYLILSKESPDKWEVIGLYEKKLKSQPANLFIEIKNEAIALDNFNIKEEIKLKKYNKYWILDKDETAELCNVCDSIGNVFDVPLSYLEIIKSEAIALEDYSPIYDRDIELVKGALYYVLDKTDDNEWKLCNTTDNIIGYAPAYLLDEIIAKTVAIHDFNPKAEGSTTIKLEKDKTYWVICKDVNCTGWWTIYNSDGLIGDAPANYFKEIIKTGSSYDEITYL